MEPSSIVAGQGERVYVDLGVAYFKIFLIHIGTVDIPLFSLCVGYAEEMTNIITSHNVHHLLRVVRQENVLGLLVVFNNCTG